MGGGGDNRKLKKKPIMSHLLCKFIGKRFIPDVLLLQMSREDQVSRTAIQSFIFNLLYQRPGI